MPRTRSNIIADTAKHIADSPSSLTRDQLEERIQASLPSWMTYPFEVSFDPDAKQWVFEDYRHQTTSQVRIPVYSDDTASTLAERLAHSIQWHEAAGETALGRRGIP